LLPLALALAACGGPALRAGAPPLGGEPLPTDPALVAGTLDNGLAYVVRRHANPPGRIAIWLHVATGSLNETEETRGLAHYLEHMAFNGSANFPPGSLIPFFQALGMTFGRDQNAFTGLDQTVYTLALPDARPETLDRGLLYLSDVAFRLALTPEEIDKERGIILEERRARAGPRQRVQEAVLARLAPESVLGRRLPIGTEETIRAMSPAQFREFYRRWYVPASMTVIAVGDVDPSALTAVIARHFGEAARAPRPEPPPVGVRPSAGTRAIVATDPGLAHAEISLTRVEPAAPPVTTVAAYRRQLVEDLGPWIFGRRLEAALGDGRVAFVRGEAWVSRWADTARMATVKVTTPPERWRPALSDLATATQQVRLHGFTEAELAEARVAFLARAEQDAQQEPTLPARQMIQRINGAVARREPVVAAAERLALERRLLPGITAEEVGRAFAVGFDPGNAVFVLTMPATASVPSEDELADLGRATLALRPPAPPQRSAPAALLAGPLRGGTVVEERVHEATGVWSGWLDNGVRVHHRKVDQRRDDAVVTITLAGGEIEETADTRGVTEAAMAAWSRPATSRLTSTDIRTLMTGKKVRVQPGLGRDTVTLTVSGDPAALESGFELAYLLLTDPVVEPGVFAQWRENEVREIAERAREPRGVLAEARADAFYPAGEARLRPVTAVQAERLGREATQAALRALIARAPIEVAVVGDIDRDRAVALIARSLGSLPPRPRIDDKTLRHLRAVPRPAGPVRVERTVPTRTEQAQVLDGFFAPDIQQTRDSRLLFLAARVLSTRMNRAIREERQLVYSIGAQLAPGEAYPGFGVFAAQAPTDPAKAGALADAVAEMFAAFAAEGPGAEEMTVARQQLLTYLADALRSPEFWSARLATLDYRGISLDDLARITADYARFTADEVREAFARYARPEARFRIVVLPERAR